MPNKCELQSPDLNLDYKLINSSLQQLSTTATKKMGGGRETMDINVIRLSDPAIIHHWCKATRIC